MCSVIERLSLTGSVLAMQATPVKPPAAAAMVPVRTVSLYSWPGSRRWTWMSIRPGATTRPAASNDSAPFGGLMRPSILATWPSSTRRSKEPSRSWLGSITRPPWIRSLAMRLLVSLVDAGEEVEDGHAHRDAVGDLLQDHGVGAVRQLARDLDAAVHRPGVHDDDVVLRQSDLVGVEAEELKVLADRGERHAPLPLELDAQHHDHVGVADGVVEGVGDLDAHRRHLRRHQGA